MDFALGLSSISAATNAAKELLNLKEIINSAEAKLKIAEIQNSLADSKTAIADYKIALSSAKDEISELKNKIKALETQAHNRATIIRKDNLFFDPNNNLYKCPNCFEKDNNIITLHGTDKQNSCVLMCRACNNQYYNPDYDEEKAKIAREEAELKKRQREHNYENEYKFSQRNRDW